MRVISFAVRRKATSHHKRGISANVAKWANAARLERVFPRRKIVGSSPTICTSSVPWQVISIVAQWESNRQRRKSVGSIPRNTALVLRLMMLVEMLLTGNEKQDDGGGPDTDQERANVALAYKKYSAEVGGNPRHRNPTVLWIT